jgi:pyruvate ferredoxin oxidoreductase delta subunit
LEKRRQLKILKQLKKHTTAFNFMKNISSIKHDISKAPKTGDWRYEVPVTDRGKCIGCGTCVKFCPEACMIVNNKKAEIDYEWCKGCGVCVEVCPVKAIIMSAQDGSRLWRKE